MFPVSLAIFRYKFRGWLNHPIRLFSVKTPWRPWLKCPIHTRLNTRFARHFYNNYYCCCYDCILVYIYKYIFINT